MRVAVLLDRFPMASETFIATGIAGLRRSGCDVTLLARRRPPRGEPVHPEVRELIRRTAYLDTELAIDSRSPVRSVPLAPGRHEILHAHFGSNARHYLFARAQADAPLVVTFHGRDSSADPREHGAAMYDELFRVADVVTYNSAHAHAALASLGCPAEKLRLVRMPIDISAFPFRERRWNGHETVRLATVARLVEKKGYELTLRALAAVRDRLPAFSYDIVGDGPLAPRLERLVATLGLGDVVRMHGAVVSHHVRNVLAEAHVFVLASGTSADGDQEGTPVSLMEAQACGLPVVSTRHGGIPEVVLDRHSGLLVAERDGEALGGALIEIVRAHQSWPELGAAGRAHVVASYDVGVCTEQLLETYRAAARAYAEPCSPAPALG